MSILLTIVAGPGGGEVPPEFAVDGEAVTLGRGTDCQLVLPSGEVSRCHATLFRQPDGQYAFVDSSSNGSSINGRIVGRGQQQLLSEGDVIKMGPFTLTVRSRAASMHAPAAATAATGWGGGNDLLGEFSQPSAPPSGPPASSAPAAPPSAGGQQDLGDLLGGSSAHDDPLAGLGGSPPAASPPAPDSLPPLSHGSPLQESFSAPGPNAAGGALPDNWDKSIVNFRAVDPDEHLGASPAPPAAQAAQGPPQPPAAPGQYQGQDALAASIAANPERFATVFREVAEQLMQGLRARSEVKAEFRAHATLIQQAQNNPLKFCVSSEDALDKMLGHDPAYLKLEEAVTEAFEDLRDHQVAQLTGLRAVFENMLQNFSPERLAEVCEERKSSGFSALSGKGRYWQFFEEYHARLNQDLDQAFNSLVSGPFAQTYSDQIKRLKRRRLVK